MYHLMENINVWAEYGHPPETPRRSAGKELEPHWCAGAAHLREWCPGERKDQHYQLQSEREVYNSEVTQEETEQQRMGKRYRVTEH